MNMDTTLPLIAQNAMLASAYKVYWSTKLSIVLIAMLN